MQDYRNVKTFGGVGGVSRVILNFIQATIIKTTVQFNLVLSKEEVYLRIKNAKALTN